MRSRRVREAPLYPVTRLPLSLPRILRGDWLRLAVPVPITAHTAILSLHCLNR